MLEKLLLAVTITFSLNLFLQVRGPNPTHIGTDYQHYQQQAETLHQMLVSTISKK
jgi:hypothetical protein